MFDTTILANVFFNVILMKQTTDYGLPLLVCHQNCLAQSSVFELPYPASYCTHVNTSTTKSNLYFLWILIGEALSAVNNSITFYTEHLNSFLFRWIQSRKLWVTVFLRSIIIEGRYHVTERHWFHPDLSENVLFWRNNISLRALLAAAGWETFQHALK